MIFMEENKENIVDENKKPNTFKKILDFLVTSTNGMALGLFSTLIVGVIITQIGTLFSSSNPLISIGSLLKSLMGIGIGVGIATSLKFDGIIILGAGVAGAIGSFMPPTYDLTAWNTLKSNNQPLLSFIATISSLLLIKLIFKKKTPVDLILKPLTMCVIAFIFTYIFAFPINFLMENLNSFINWATEITPFFMGIIISVVMGICLTLPISSAAISMSINLSGIAGGAAVVGCCTQMVGFAIQSIYDNNIGGVLSIGVGTSMLQFKNILKKPIIWLPTIISSAILGPFSTLVFKIRCNKEGAGMGTSGLVGQFGTVAEMTSFGTETWKIYLFMILGEIILPIVLTFLIDFIFRKFNLIKKGDLAL